MRFETEKIKKLPVDSIGEVPKSKKFIKLNSNENPYKISLKIKLAVWKEMRKANRYPDPNCTELKKKIAIKFNSDFNLNLTTENIFVANGSDEVIAFLTQAFFENCEKPLIFPSITYCPDIWAELYSATYQTFPNKPDFNIDVDALCIENCSGVYIANPNTTGLVLTLNEIEKLAKFHNGKRVVIVDEAYIDFGGESAIKLVKKYDNLVITRSFSKSYGLAGFRIGYAIAHKDIIKALSKLKDSFGIVETNRLSLKAGEKSLDCEKYIFRNIEKIKKTRDNFIKQLQKSNFEIIPSQANFVWIKIDKNKHRFNAKYFYEQLKKQNIFVRYFGTGWNKDWIRITIGTQRQMNKTLKIIKKI